MLFETEDRGLEVARAVLGDRFAGRTIVLGGARKIGVEHRIRLAIRASWRRELDRCCGPSLAVISTDRSGTVASGDGGIGGEGCSPIFAAVWFSGPAWALVRLTARRSGAGESLVPPPGSRPWVGAVGVAASLRAVGDDLEDRREPGLEAAPRRAQVQPPHAHALLARERLGALGVVVEPARPVAQRLRVVGPEALDVWRLEAGALDRELDPRQVQRRRVGEHEALGERPGLGVAEAQPRDAVVEQAARPAAVTAPSSGGTRRC